MVEIWQADQNGAYLHSGTGNAERRDAHFQGFGRFLTGSTGEYLFRTIKPVPLPRPDPAHPLRASRSQGREKLTTQCYIKGHPGNARDMVLRGIRDPKARESVLVRLQPDRRLLGRASWPPGSTCVLGFTPEA